jgi:Calx-beta domain-containing protein
MSIPQLCAAAQCCFPRRIPNAFAVLLILFISASAAFGATLVVPAGGDLQAAINAAAAGDTIVLEAGATYVGPFILPKKSGDSYITIQSSRTSEISGRVSPSQSGLLAKLRSNVGGDPIIRTAAGAHHYQLIGLDLSTSNASDLIYDLVRLGAGDSSQTDLSNVPHHLILDRLWIHGFATQPVQRGISLNSAETTIINSYISDIHGVGFDTQAVCGWNGPGPFHIVNNYLEAAGENVMFGGSPPSIPNLVPSNIEIRRNYFFKPLSWKVGHSSYAGIHWSIKNLLEFKNARNVIVDANLLENSWTDAQIGYAVLFTVRSEQGKAPWAIVENISFTNNTVKNTEQGFQLLGSDYPYQSGRGNGLVVANNLFTGITNRFLTMSGFYNVRLDHNTHFQTGNVTALYGEPSIGFVYTNNITIRSGYGFFGDNVGEGTAALTTYTPGAVFQKNLIAGAPSSQYPPGNFYPSTINGVLDSTYQLVDSTYKLAGTDGMNLGCDVNALNAAQSGASAGGGPTPSPSPTPSPTPTPAPAPGASLQFSAASYTANEGEGSITIAVSRSGSTDGTASVQFATSDGSASSPGDYRAMAGTLTFAAGESSKTFTVLLTNDTSAEANETFSVSLTNVSNATLGSPASATVTVVDNDNKRRRGSVRLTTRRAKILME